MDFDYEVIVDPQLVGEVASALDREEKFAFDLETTSLDFNRGAIHGIGLATRDKAWYLCLGAEKAFLPLFKNLVESKLVIGHNILFDMHFINKYGIRPRKIADTMIGQYLVDENKALGLKKLIHPKLGITEELPDYQDLLHLSKRLLGRKRLSDVTIFDIPLDTLAEYGARDPRLTYDLWEVTEYELAKEGMTSLFWESEMPFVQVLLDMEESGFYIDQPLLKELGQELADVRDQAKATWEKLSGGVNPNSPMQLEKYLFGDKRYPIKYATKTKGARRGETDHFSTDAMALYRLLPLDKNGEIAALLTFRKYDKLIGTYITAFEEFLWDGYLYGRFNRTSTVTGRLASSSPNMQNIPARSALGHRIRTLFSSPPGQSFVSVDQSQFELRLLAHYSKDARMTQVFAENGDPHQMTADLISGLGFNITRKHAKSVNFGWAYGMGPKALQDNIEKAAYDNMSVEEIKQAGMSVRPALADTKVWMAGFGKAYPDAETWKLRVIQYARELGYVKTIGGRKRRLPQITSYDNSLRSQAERQAVNSIIQGGVADIMQWSMIEIAKFQDAYGARLLAQVHDELNWNVPEQAAQEFGERASKVMTDAGERFGLRIKLIAEPGIGNNWGDAKK